MHDGVSCVAAGEHNLEANPPPQRLVGQLPTVHAARQSDIRKQKRNLAVGVE